MKEEILKEILQELKNLHSHLENIEVFYKFINRVEMKKEEVTADKK